MKLRSHLIILAIAALVPLLIFSTVMVFVRHKQQRAALEDRLLDTARALSLVIDRELTASIRTLEALATSEHLDSGDLKKFYEQAMRLLKAREDWDNILLADSSGRQLLNLRRPLGSPLPPVGELEEFQQVIETSRPVVSDLYFGRVSRKHLIGVSVPVVRNGKARYVLMSSRPPMSLLQILAQQSIPPDWLGTIADNKGIIIARTRNIEQMIGKPAMPVPGADDQSANESLSLGATPDGTAVELAFRRSELTGWSVRLAIPASDLEAPLRRLLLLTMAVELALLGVAVVLAIAFGRRIASPIHNLSRSRLANDLRGGKTPHPTISSIVEVNQVSEAIRDAARARNQIEDALREQSRLLDLYFRYALNPVVFLDRDFNFIRVNEAYARACQRDVSEFPGHNHFEFYPSDARAIFEEVVKTKKPFQTFARPFVFPDHPEWGVTYWDWTLVPILDDSGEVELLVFSLNDVTQRKRAEEDLTKTTQTLRAVIEASPAAINILDVDGNVKLWNPAAERTFGWTEQEVLGRFVPVVPEDKRGEFQELYKNVLQGRYLIGAEVRRQKKDGSLIDVSLSTAPLRDGKGEIIGSVGSLADITERKQARETLRNYAQRLKTLSRRIIEVQETDRRHIARELHDEIGQALTALKINIQANLKPVQDLSVNGPLKARITENIGIVDRLLQQVRDLSLHLRPSMLDDLGLVPALRWYIDQQAQRAGLAAQFSADPQEMRLSPEIETTCFRIAQEALTNVVRHAQASQVSIELRESNSTLRMLIRDNGVGFDVHAMREHAAKGGSLGLLGMEERAALVGGQIEIESKPTVGTDVRVSLPLAPSEASGSPTG